MKRYRKNVKLDAQMVDAAMKGMFVPFCIAAGMNANDAFARAEWLKNQNEAYIKQVADAVLEMQIKPAHGLPSR